MYSVATVLGVMTSLDTIVCHCWFLMLIQMYMSLVFVTPRFDGSSNLSYIHLAALTHEIQYTHVTFISNPTLADLSICRVFLSGI